MTLWLTDSDHLLKNLIELALNTFRIQIHQDLVRLWWKVLLGLDASSGRTSSEAPQS